MVRARLLPGICLFSLRWFQSLWGVLARLSFTKFLSLSPLSRWQQRPEGAPYGLSLGHVISLETQALNRRGPQAAKRHWGTSCQCTMERQGPLSPPLRPQHPGALHISSPITSPWTETAFTVLPAISDLTNLLVEERATQQSF